MVTEIDRTRRSKWHQIVINIALGVHGRIYWGVVRFWNGVLGKQINDPKSQISASLTDKINKWAIFGRERQGAGEEKEERLLRNVDCIFKSWLFVEFKDWWLGFQNMIQHAAPQGRRIYGLPPLPPTFDFWFVCLGCWILGLWFCVLGLLWDVGLSR